jgi:macrolide transport system ATP-binding/permease protein
MLSILGVMIGVSCLIAMLSLGTGAQKDVQNRISSLGSNLLMVSSGRSFRGGIAQQSGSSTRLTIQDSEQVRQLPDVTGVSPYVNGNAQVVYGGKNWSTRITGTTVDYVKLKNAQPVLGRFFTEEETISRKKVAVIGKTIVDNIFGSNNPLGEFIKINRSDFQVIGVLPSKGSSGWQNQDDVIILPLNTAMYRLLGKEYIDSMDVQVDDTTMMERVTQRLTKLILSLHRLPPDKEDVLDIHNMAEIQETITSTIKTFSYLLGAIAFVSLLVGGIGIMNIMLVSVTERTREIGLRKAIGANNKDILFQFVIESVIICVMGGIIGILFGASIALIFSKLAKWSTSVSIGSISLAFTFSLLIGLIFGLWPARKASLLNPIDALRYE